MITYLEAIYIGRDGQGYHKRHTYCLELRQHWFGKITIRPTHGYHYKPLEGMRCTYQSLRSFLRHWSVVKVLDPHLSISGMEQEKSNTII